MKIDVTFHDLSPDEASRLVSVGAQAFGAVTVSQQVQQPQGPTPAQIAQATGSMPGPGAVPPPAGPPPGSPVTAQGVTHDQVKAAMSNFIGQHKAAAAKKILDQHGVARVGEAPIDKLPALLQAFSNPPAV